MGLEATHPDYDARVGEWTTQRDLAEGETAVKAKREVYLPPTPSMLLDGFGKGAHTVGEQVYSGYLKRAQFPDYVSEGIEILVGMLHYKPPKIDLPPALEPLRDSCTLSGESLEDLLRAINTEQLITGRVGLLVDLPAAQQPVAQDVVNKRAGAPLPYIATYVAEAIRNWDEAVLEDGYTATNLVVLDESGYERSADFTWRTVRKYRVLVLGSVLDNEPEGTAVYRTATFTDTGAGVEYSEAAMTEPTYMGKKLEEVPFVFINTKDLVTRPDKPPLQGLGRLVLAVYRGEADYRQNLFMQGQDTLVVIGGVRNPDGLPGEDEAVRTGAGARLDVDVGGDAKYIGVNSQGLAEQRASLENDHKRAATKSGQLLPSGRASTAESGEALKTRLAAQTASMTQIALTGAKGLEGALKLCATWMGADPELVKVTPNMEFGDIDLKASDLKTLMEAKLVGAPLSKRSVHELLVEKRLTSMEFEEEMELVKEEEAEAIAAMGSTAFDEDEGGEA